VGDVPTRLPTAVLLNSDATSTSVLPPTRTPNPTPTPLPTATKVFATRTPTPVFLPNGPAVNITIPSVNSELVMGTEVSIGGLGQLLPSDTLSVTLVSATGHRLAEVTAEMTDINSWEVELTVPQLVSGPAQIQAAVFDENHQLVALDVHAVHLALDTDTTDKYMALFRPTTGEQAVAGYNLFFDGRAQEPTGNYITISLWDQNCQNRIAVQGFRLNSSTYWQGFLVVPRDATGPVCAVADFGERGDPDWREAQVLLEIIPPTDENAKGVMVGNPPPNATLTAGKSILLYGTAYNAPNSEVVVSVTLENGRILTEVVATVDIFGYWETSLFVPDDAEGPAMINVSIGTPSEDNYAQNQTVVTIQ
ncbi:MAG: hypothetical protein WAM60_21900, partial [Candidatus Promineifilaceae bacterium]